MRSRGGLQGAVLDNIRAEIWLKLWGNLVFNPVSALTRATLEGIAASSRRAISAAAMMAEAQAVANKLGITVRVTIDKRIAGAEKVGAHKTSMLQDVEAGREPEVEALVGSVVELARLTHTPRRTSTRCMHSRGCWAVRSWQRPERTAPAWQRIHATAGKPLANALDSRYFDSYSRAPATQRGGPHEPQDAAALTPAARDHSMTKETK